MAIKPDSKVRVALVGCGRIGVRHARILADHPDVELVGMVDVERNRAEVFARDHGGRAYSGLEEMLGVERPDLVDICTPSGNHAELVLAAVKAGVANVVVEKPMALRLEDADAMIAACDAASARLFVVKQNRYNLPIRKLREAVDEGRFGRAVLGTIRVRWCRRQNYYDLDPWRGTWAQDGGVFANQASHHVDMLSYMMGPVASLSAMTTTRLVDIEVEDTGVCILRFESGALGVIEATTAARPVDLEGSISVLGEHGTVEVGGFAMNEIKVWRFDEERPGDKDVVERFSTNPPDVYGFGHHEYLKDVIAAIKADGRPLIDGREGRRSLELITAIYEASETGRMVQLPVEPKASKLGRR